ncbi:MAG TPA: DUF3667 domain-containing protein [Ignavibacteria bacterium]|nr:hypothetical protein [Bacteroidota bacterium]HRE11243.1 DUF3667 domain-containing protein [Ignavibacteria bacterium]HRF64727.1 DUF3667 domain-containing protein [Ignavibacteria bacterium]HRJ05849.1 DUF3667 domain-containing protein [Ignavibacteria bacterium]
MDTCTNCGNEFSGKYCPECGQGRIKRLEVKTIVHDVTHGILHWENSILKTFKALLFKPGKTVNEYIEGKRKHYVKPFSYFIFIQTLFVVFFHRLSEKYFAFINYTITGDSGKFPEKALEFQHMVSQNINYFNYFMPVIFAFMLYLFFRKKKGINYAEALAASFYWVATALVFSVLLMLISILDVRTWNLRFAASTVYYIICIKTFSGESWGKGIIKGILVTALSYIIFVLFIVILVVLYLNIAD